MNKYTELSDFEINKKVSQALGIDVEETVVFKNGGEDIRNHSSNLVLMKKISSNRKFWKIYDPCNNPTDAMPIIIESGISMVRVNNTWSARQFNNHCIEINGDDYFRIAMICFLLMKDAENETNNKR